MSNKNPKILLFDLGGVIIHLYPEKTIEAFAELSDKSPEEVQQAYENASIFQQHEKGLITNEAFRNQLKSDFSIQATDEEFDRAWNAMLGEIPAQVIEQVKQLQKKFSCCVLSNTNAIHEKAFHQILHNHYGINHLNQIFDHVFFSHELNERKPEAAIYHKVIRMLNTNASGILFLDDSELNIEAAISVGLQGLHIPRNEGFSELLTTYLEV